MAAVPMNALTYVDGATVTAVVRYGLDVGVYDVVIINPAPNYDVGVLMGGLVVSYQPPPVIANVFPDSFAVTNPNPQATVCDFHLTTYLLSLSSTLII
jgi:hypothetical protein